MLKLDESLFESLPAEVGEEEQIKEFIERLSEIAVEELSLEDVEEIQTTASQLAATAKDLGGAPPGVQEALLGPSGEMLNSAQQSQELPQLVMPEEI